MSNVMKMKNRANCIAICKSILPDAIHFPKLIYGNAKITEIYH